MSVDYTKIYKFDDSFELIQRDQKYLYVNYEEVNWFRTNETGKTIIDKIDGIKSLDEILNEYANEVSFDPNDIKASFNDYIENMINSQLIYDIDREAEVIEQKKSEEGVPDTISDLWIHVSGKCNLSCPFCYSLSGENNSNTLEYDKIIKFVSGIPEEKRNNIVISGGEPFLYDDLERLVKTLNEMKFKSILIITNGTVGQEKYENVIPYVTGIQVSVDGTSAEIHDISRGKGSFDKMIKNLELLSKMNVPRLIISFTPTMNNIRNLPDIPKFAYEHNVDAIHVTRLMPVGRGEKMDDELSIESELYTENLKQFLDNFNKIEEIIEIDRELYKNDRSLISLSFAGDQTYKVAYKQRKWNCGAGLGSLSIYFNGKIYPCASLQNTPFVLGTIDTSVDEVIKNAQQFMKDYSVNTLPKCKECKFKYMCGGGCRACAYSCHNKDIYSEDPMCERYQKEMIELLWTIKRNRIVK